MENNFHEENFSLTEKEIEEDANLALKDHQYIGLEEVSDFVYFIKDLQKKYKK